MSEQSSKINHHLSPKIPNNYNNSKPSTTTPPLLNLENFQTLDQMPSQTQRGPINQQLFGGKRMSEVSGSQFVNSPRSIKALQK